MNERALAILALLAGLASGSGSQAQNLAVPPEFGGRAAVSLPARPYHPPGVERPPGRLLGTFYPEATVNIMGSDSQRGGYAPLDMYGLSTMSFVGPLSAYRTKSAPIVTYSRGYDGIVRPSIGISLSYPNFPAASPVVYPTRANNYFGFRTTDVPPWWTSSTNWIDQD